MPVGSEVISNQLKIILLRQIIFTARFATHLLALNTMISDRINSIFGCWNRFMVLIATVVLVNLSVAVNTFPDAPIPICLMTLYLSLGLFGFTMFRRAALNSSSVI